MTCESIGAVNKPRGRQGLGEYRAIVARAARLLKRAALLVPRHQLAQRVDLVVILAVRNETRRASPRPSAGTLSPASNVAVCARMRITLSPRTDDGNKPCLRRQRLDGVRR